MPLTATKGEGGEASRSRARRRRRRRRPAHTLTPAVTDGNEAQTLAASSDKRKDPPEQTQSESWKRARAADQSREDEGDKKGARGTTAAAAASASSGERHASSSSEVSSPLRWPYIAPITEGGNCSRMDPAIEDAFDVLEMKYREKRKNQLKLVTLDPYMPPSCMENANLLTVRESATQIILEEAKVVLSLSSYVDGELVAQSSGFLIDWDENSKTGTVLTSALLICKNSSSSDQWLFQEEYVPNVEVCAQLLDKYETVVPARLLHFDKHFNIALFKVHMNSCARIPTFNTKVMYGQGVFVLSRDKDLNLDVKHGHVQFRGPTKYERHHFLFMGCMISQAAIGGPVIDHNGQILGMVTVSGTSFIPSSVILKCLDMFKKFNCIPRLHIGMQFSAIKFLDLNHVEKISRKCNVSSGLIVTEVSHGSVAEKLGIRIGDIIVSIDGECIATTVELENLLLQMCESHLDKKISIGSSIDVPLNVFHTRIGSGRTINLRLNISDELEVFSRGDYLVSARDCA